jgi:hypothetical protein
VRFDEFSLWHYLTCMSERCAGKIRRISTTALTWLAAAAIAVACAGEVQAEPCSRDAFAKVVNDSGAALRRLSADTQPKMQAAFRRLKDKNGWREEDYIDKANALVVDERSEQLDQKATELLARLDRLAEDSTNVPESCSRLAELEATALELQATVKTKTDYLMARAEAAIGDAPKPQPKPLPGSPPVAKPAPREPGKVAEKAPGRTGEKSPGKTADSSWSATTQHNPTVAENVMPGQPYTRPDPSLQSPSPGAPTDDGYSIDEIRAATRGFFGTISTSLASVIEYAFAQSGRPSAYVLGNEGGGALIAGVRYGKGTLYLRSGGTREVYWHGPSIGYDLGAAGGKTMFLIYRLQDPENLFKGFTGIDGSAYVVGGVGLTFLTDGKVLMAPIRSGLGLRLGANIGYIRFTAQPTWNPF